MKNICLLPWIHLEARPNGDASPCCLYKGTCGNFAKHSVDEIWKSSELTQLRTEFLQGKQPKGCAKCWNTEKSNNKSKRQTDLERFVHHSNSPYEPIKDPIYLDLKLGTICNIKCRTCNTYSSSKWADDEIKLIGTTQNPNLQSIWVHDDSPFWLDIEKILPTIEYFDFTGGEPFLVKKHLNILEKCIELGYSKNISLHYNTNGTITPTQKMLDIWKKFKWVEVMFSIDGINDRFDYIRHPAKWNNVLENFNFVKEQNYLHVTVCHTVSVLNVLYLNEFLHWFDSTGLHNNNLYLNLLHEAEFYCIKNLAPITKKKIIKRLNTQDTRIKKVLDFMNLKGSNKNKEFLDYTLRLDSIRNENFDKTFARLKKIL